MDEQADRQERRQRKKKLVADVRQLLEFYFSPANLSKDRFMKQKLDLNPFIDIEVFEKFNKLKSLTTDHHIIKKAVKTSEVLELSEDHKAIGRCEPYKEKEDELECTIYIENLPTHTDRDWIQRIFSYYGTIDYISLPRYKRSGQPKGFAFVEFSSPDEAKAALAAYGRNSPDLPKPEKLQSIITHEENDSAENPQTNSEEMASQPARKRSREDSNEDIDSRKKIKTEHDDDDKAEEGEIKKRKKRKRTKKELLDQDAIFLSVMSKKEWKKLRNTYLDTQRSNYKMYRETDKHEAKFQDTFCNPGRNPPVKSTMPEYVQNVIVKLAKPVEEDLVVYRKALQKKYDQIAYVDVKPGADKAFIRFRNAQAASEFLKSHQCEDQQLVTGSEEAIYWDYIFASWSKQRPKKQKKDLKDTKLKPGTYRNPWGKDDSSTFNFD